MNASETLDERLVDATTGALELFSIHVGRRLGLYDHLVEPLTAGELADRAGINLRYAREWLEQQAVAGFVTVANDTHEWDERRYHLDADQQATLVTADDLAHVSPLADSLAGIGAVIDQVVDAYRSGDGVPYASYGDDFRAGQAGINRPAFTHDLPTAWLEAVPGMKDRLAEGGRVADLGTGTGFATIAMGAAYPRAEVIGYDSDPASIVDAQANASAAGAGANVGFRQADASSLVEDGPFDLVLILEALHDLAQPVEVLVAARKALAPGGAVLIADEKVAEQFTAPGDLLERMMYGWSVLHCLPAALADQPSAAIGTVIRPGLVEALAREAGFANTTVSEVDAGFFRLYVLD